MKYSYFGLVFGTLKARLVLLKTILVEPGSHAAVWIGVNDDKRWLQAGIAQEQTDGTPFVYIEAGELPSEKRTYYRFWPTTLGSKHDAKLVKRRAGWTVTIDGHSYGPLKVANAQIDSCLEVLGPVQAVASVNGHIIKGRGT